MVIPPSQLVRPPLQGMPRIRIQLRVARIRDILAVHLVPEPAARGTWTPHWAKQQITIVILCVIL